MNDTKRVYAYLYQLLDGWGKLSNQRFGQLISNYFLWLEQQGIDPFYLPDQEMFEKFNEYIAIFTEVTI